MGTCRACSQGRRQPCPVFIHRPGLAVYPSGAPTGCNWLRRSRSTPQWGSRTRTNACPRRSTKSALPRTKVTAVGTSTNCSASCGSKNARCGMESCGTLGTAMTCSRIAVSRSLRTSTSWSPVSKAWPFFFARTSLFYRCCGRYRWFNATLELWRRKGRTVVPGLS